jgi:hypothetical protein
VDVDVGFDPAFSFIIDIYIYGAHTMIECT